MPSADQMVRSNARLVDWNVEVFAELIKNIVARRSNDKTPSQEGNSDFEVKLANTPLEEVREIIALPEYQTVKSRDPNQVVIPDVVVESLRKYGM